MTFNPEIVSVDTCRVYHSGPNYFVEIDIVLDPEMPLWKAHDISQDLQDQIETLPDVDRCFVHVDHEVDHKPVCHSYVGDMENADLYRNIGRKYRARPILDLLIALHTYTCSYGKAINVFIHQHCSNGRTAHSPRESRDVRRRGAAATPVLALQRLHVIPGASTNVC
jgi:hypothetical protein